MSIQESKLTAIADAIRYAESSTEPIPAPAFPDRIRALKSGGGGSGGGVVVADGACVPFQNVRGVIH